MKKEEEKIKKKEEKAEKKESAKQTELNDNQASQAQPHPTNEKESQAQFPASSSSSPVPAPSLKMSSSTTTKTHSSGSLLSQQSFQNKQEEFENVHIVQKPLIEINHETLLLSGSIDLPAIEKFMNNAIQQYQTQLQQFQMQQQQQQHSNSSSSSSSPSSSPPPTLPSAESAIPINSFHHPFSSIKTLHIGNISYQRLASSPIIPKLIHYLFSSASVSTINTIKLQGNGVMDLWNLDFLAQFFEPSLKCVPKSVIIIENPITQQRLLKSYLLHLSKSKLESVNSTQVSNSDREESRYIFGGFQALYDKVESSKLLKNSKENDGSTSSPRTSSASTKSSQDISSICEQKMMPSRFKFPSPPAPMPLPEAIKTETKTNKQKTRRRQCNISRFQH